MIWFGYRWDGLIVGADLSFGSGKIEDKVEFNGVENILAEAELLATEMHFRLLPKSFVQPFLMIRRQASGPDLSDAEAERRYVTYSGFGLRFKFSAGVSISLARYEDSPDDATADPNVYTRAQLDFAF